MDLLNLLTIAVESSASDLHLVANSPPLSRVDGEIRRLSTAVLSANDLHVMLFAAMEEFDKVTLEKNRETDFLLTIPQLARFRVNVFNQLHGLSAVFRIIPDKIATLAQLNAPPVLAELAMKQKGLVLVTGATGSGKSTTLAAMVDHINCHRYCHILTIEDPVEFIHYPNRAIINQRQLKQHTLTPANALRAALRQDPDVILIGEIRDADTMSLALTAAETGHLVLSTLHTSSAPKTINRIIDVVSSDKKDMIRGMLSESLAGVVAQMLLPQLGGGRVAAWEVMLGSAAISNLVRENKTSQMYSVMQTNRAAGMQTLEHCLDNLLKQQKIAPEVVENLKKNQK